MGTRLRLFGFFTGISNILLCWIYWAKTGINVVYLGVIHIWRQFWTEGRGCRLSKKWDANGSRGWWVSECSGRPIVSLVFFRKPAISIISIYLRVIKMPGQMSVRKKKKIGPKVNLNVRWPGFVVLISFVHMYGAVVP